MKAIMVNWRCEYENSGTDPFTDPFTEQKGLYQNHGPLPSDISWPAFPPGQAHHARCILTTTPAFELHSEPLSRHRGAGWRRHCGIMHIQSKTETKQKGREALGKEAGRLIGCPICKKELPAPTPRGTNSPWCPTCAVVVLRYAPFWDDNIRRRLETLMSRLSVARACDICRAPFSLERSVCASSSSSAGAGVDLLYPNLYVNICPACFGKAFAEHLGGSRSANAKRLHEPLRPDRKSAHHRFRHADLPAARR